MGGDGCLFIFKGQIDESLVECCGLQILMVLIRVRSGLGQGELAGPGHKLGLQ